MPNRVLGFLAAHDDHAFKAREIATQVGLDAGVVKYSPLAVEAS